MIFPRGSSFNPDYYGPIIVPYKGMVLDISHGSIEQWQTFIEREGHRVNTDTTGIVTVDGVPRAQYVVEQNYFFAMGDNREESLDRCYWGFVPEENIVGKAMFVYRSWETPFRPATSAKNFRESVGHGSGL